jgi:hypothetical protein
LPVVARPPYGAPPAPFSMTSLRTLFLCSILPVLRLGAVYAPIPEVEQGKPLTVYLAAGIHYDSNIFGGSANEVSSLVYELNPGIVFNASLRPTTFASAAYRLSLAHVPDRPGDRTLDSHELSARVAHTFSPQTEVEVSNTYQIAKNPESLLPGLATVVNTDQSYRRNQFDARFATSLSRRTGLTFKARATRFDYQDDALGVSLDRDEYLGGLALSHTLHPALQTMMEFRHLAIDYGSDSTTKDKRSDFLLLGADYVVNARTGLSARGGVEHRRRSGDKDETSPYVELGAKHDYGKGSYLAGGYSYSIEETSNVDRYTDIRVNRVFLNVQHAISAKLSATASASWEPSVLQGRQGVSRDLDETNRQAGVALIYRPRGTWSVSLTVDWDHIKSDDPGRMLERTRGGMTARYAF